MARNSSKTMRVHLQRLLKRTIRVARSRAEVSSFTSEEIIDAKLERSLRRGIEDVKAGRGRFV